MISAVRTQLARKVALNPCGVLQKQMQHRTMASSLANFVSASIKDAVKSSVLEEAARPDSKMWGGHSDTQYNHNHNKSKSNNAAHHPQSFPDHVNDPISPARLLMLYDPLDEWHLERTPAGLAAPPITPETDPFILSKADMQTLSQSIRTDLIGSDHPVLFKAASYFFEEGPDLFQAQRRLAEISEMIHTASLFHDDVIDGADTRRGSPAVHKVFGDKMAILAGDYLLARASVFLARLRDVEVVETMSTIIEHLVRGEVMQMKGSNVSDSGHERLIQYLRKNFYKTASLMANSCKSAAILGGYNDDVVGAAYRYGKHLGIAFQLVDDVLDYDGSASAMGKPALSDLSAGLATAPVLFAAEIYPDALTSMIDRKFRNEGDVELAVDYVRKSDGIQRTKDLAQVHVELAIESIAELGPSVYRDSLIQLAHKVVDRSR